MRKRSCFATALGLVLFATVTRADTQRTYGEFREFSISFEANETDGDAEVVVVAKAFEGMERFSLSDPSGRRVIDLRTQDRRDIGSGQILIESAEPAAARVRAAYPAGPYRFAATTVGGERLAGTAILTHALLSAPVFSRERVDVDPDNAIIEWSVVPGAAGYVLEVEQEDLGVSFVVQLPPLSSSFRIPEGFLVHGTEYDIGIGTLTPTGNLAVAEGTFMTADTD